VAGMIQSYPWYIADWRESETRIRLSLAERALYREMLDYCYLEGSLPSDPVQLSRICGCSVNEVRRHFEVVSCLFCKEGDRLTHAKVTEVRAKLDAYHKQKSHAGAASGRTRRQQAIERQTNGRSTGVEPSPAPAPAPSPDPEPEPTLEPVAAATVALEVVPPISENELIAATADRLCKRHPKPRTCGPAEARKHLHAIVGKLPKADRAAKLQRIDRNHQGWCESEQWTKDGGAYAKSLANWLAPTMGRYDMEPPSRAPTGTGSKSGDAVLDLARRNFERTGRLFG
jgi:uncharacterized protein YdaU (DUF1376 family)